MIHLVCQSQGGVGKTLISVLLTQYLRDRGHTVRAYDLDPFTQTFASFEALHVEQPDVWCVNGGELGNTRFDAFVEELMLNPCDGVVDVGSRAFTPWVYYLASVNWAAPFHEASQGLCIHLVVVGGLRLRETLWDLAYLAQRFAPGCPLVVWLNTFFGPIVSKGAGFESMPAYEAHRHHLYGLVRLSPLPTSACEGDMAPIFADRLTLAACLALDGLGLMQKKRLHQFQQELYNQLDVVLPTQAVSP